MDFIFLDHNATEHAIGASEQYAHSCALAIESIKRIYGQLAEHWQGNSYDAFGILLQEVILELETAISESQTASIQLTAGQERAHEDERRARQAWEEQQRRSVEVCRVDP